MDSTFHALGQLILQALPTFVIVVLLHFYLKAVFFKPMERLLAERKEATEGARKKAADALARAEAKAADYDEQIRNARNEIYREQEEQRRKWRDEQSAQIAVARAKTDEQIQAAKSDLAAQAEEARRTLAGEAQFLADRITESILRRRTA